MNPGPLGCKPSPSSRLVSSSSFVSHGLTTGKSGQEPRSVDNCLVVTPGLLEGFRRWLLAEEGTSEETVRKYMYYLPRIVGIRLCGKEDVSLAFERMKLTKVSYEAFSRLLTFVERKLEGFEELVAKLRKAMPRKPGSREDTYVPPDTLVRQAVECARRRGQVYYLFALVLAYSGVRGTEARYVLENAGRLRAVRLPYGAVRVHLPPEMTRRGSKREYLAYMPERLWIMVKSYGGSLPHQDTLEKVLRECGLAVKHFRKWWRQKAKELGIDSETIEAFQGRPRTVGGRHYTDWIPILDKEYEKMLQAIQQALKALAT